MREDTDPIRQLPSAAAADRLRLLARRARATARGIRRRRGRAPITSDYGPFEYRGGVLEVRALRPADGPSWSEACIANGDVIRPWWPPSSDWERDHDRVAFLAHKRDFERMAARGIAANFAIVTNGLLYGETTALLGEAGSTRAELVLWGDTRVGDKAPLLASCIIVIDHLFDDVGLHRLELYQSVDNRNPRGISTLFQFTLEGVARGYRLSGGELGDYRMLSLLRHEWPEARQKPLALLARLDPQLGAALATSAAAR